MTLKRDLICRLLKFAEEFASPNEWAIPKDCNFKGWGMEEVHEHIKLGEEFGWLEIENQGTMAGPEYAIRRLTAQGHLELQRCRDKG